MSLSIYTTSAPSRAVSLPEMKKGRKQLLKVFTHILLWLIFLCIPAVFNSQRHGISIWRFIDDLMEPPRWTNALLLIAVFYSNYYYIIPRLYIKSRYFLLSNTVAVWFTIFFLLNYMLTPPEVLRAGNGGFEALGNSFNLFMFIIVYALAFALCLYEQWQTTKEQMLHTEISFLKAQINPHFLFNTLNSIYSLALTKSDNTADAVVKLSNMMRYSVSDNNQDFVSLSKEIAYISNYIDLQRLRLTDNIKISYEVYGDVDGKQIAPFLFIPFVENAFKHGVNSEEDSEIVIKIEMEEKYLLLKVVNNKVKQRTDRDTGTGLGIDTTRKRLNLIYPGKHKLHINNNISTFRVSLQINLQ